MHNQNFMIEVWRWGKKSKYKCKVEKWYLAGKENTSNT